MTKALIAVIILCIVEAIVIFILYAKLVVKNHQYESLKTVWEYDVNYYRKDNQHLHSRVNRLVSELCAERRKNKEVEK